MAELERVRALRTAGHIDDYLAAIRELARRAPSDVEVRIEAAYACDAHATEDEAIGHYDAAWQLGVPDGELRHFVVGYGSTLRNVGRIEESIAILGEALVSFPEYAPLRAFLGLSLAAAGHHRAALATMLDLALELGDERDAFDGYQRALAEYHRALLDDELSR